MTAAARAAYGLALLAGLPPALLLASSCVAFHFRFAPELGTPLWWHLYDPLAVVRWAWSWGWRRATATTSCCGLSLARSCSAAAGGGPAAARDAGAARRPRSARPAPGSAPPPTSGASAPSAAAGPASSSGSTAGGRCSRPATCTRLVLGPTRTGKGVNNIVPTLLTWTDSALVLDFKGELASIAGPMRAHLGKVYTIDATSPRSARFNPLLAVRTGPEMMTDAQALAAHAGATRTST